MNGEAFLSLLSSSENIESDSQTYENKRIKSLEIQTWEIPPKTILSRLPTPASKEPMGSIWLHWGGFTDQLHRILEGCNAVL